jgi:prepilin peptidase CpaA
MDWQTLFLEHWPTKVVCLLLIWAAWIDGKELRVPNWLTFPMVFAGLALNTYLGGWEGFQFGLWGMAVGLATLMPLYAVGGMGAGDVKLMAGMGAWLGGEVTWWAFVVSVVVGAVMALVMAMRNGRFQHHYGNALMILNEWWTIRDPRQLSSIARERKPRMQLLPYGIPICIGSIAYFIYAGLV